MLKKLNIQNELIPLVNFLSRSFTDMISKKIKQNGINLTREQALILRHLYYNDGIVQNELAYISNRDKTTLTRLINKLENKTLLSRVSCSNDQRCKKIFISEAGKELIQQVIPLVDESMHKLMNNITNEEVNNAVQTLHKLMQNIENSHEIKPNT